MAISLLQLLHSISKTWSIDAANHPAIFLLVVHRMQSFRFHGASAHDRHQPVAFIKGASDPWHHPRPCGAVAHNPRQTSQGAAVGVAAMDGVGRMELRLAPLDGDPPPLADVQLGLVQGEVEVIKTSGQTQGSKANLTFASQNHQGTCRYM